MSKRRPPFSNYCSATKRVFFGRIWTLLDVPYQHTYTTSRSTGPKQPAFTRTPATTGELTERVVHKQHHLYVRHHEAGRIETAHMRRRVHTSPAHTPNRPWHRAALSSPSPVPVAAGIAEVLPTKITNSQKPISTLNINTAAKRPPHRLRHRGDGDGGDGVPRVAHGVEDHDAHHGMGRRHGMG